MRRGLFARFSRATKRTAGRIINGGQFARRRPVFSKGDCEFAGNDDGSDSRVSTRMYFNQDYFYRHLAFTTIVRSSCIPAYERAWKKRTARYFYRYGRYIMPIICVRLLDAITGVTVPWSRLSRDRGSYNRFAHIVTLTICHLRFCRL